MVCRGSRRPNVESYPREMTTNMATSSFLGQISTCKDASSLVAVRLDERSQGSLQQSGKFLERQCSQVLKKQRLKRL